MWRGVYAVELGANPFANVEAFIGVVLGIGNKAVYDDMYWQHDAFAYAQRNKPDGMNGAAFLKRLGVGGMQLAAWNKIQQGIDNNMNAQMIYDGNIMLLKYEQQQILQPKVFDPLNGTPGLGILLGAVAGSPWGGKSAEQFQRGINIANFDQRWNWMVNSLMPDWKEYRSNPDNKASIEAYLNGLIKEDAKWFPKKAP